MNVTLSKTSDVSGKLIVDVTENDYSDKVNSELKKIQKTVTVPGFRKGAVPMSQVKRRYEKAVKSDVINEEVYKAVNDYLREEKLNILGSPMAAEVKEINAEDKDYTFEFEIGLAPELDVVVDKSVELPYYQIEVSDQMIDEQDKELLNRFGSQVPGEEADERAVIKGSLQQLNADGTVNTNDGAIQVISAIIAPFTFKSKEEADKFLGKKVNDKVVFNPYKSCDGSPVEMGSMLNLDKDIAKDVKDDFEFAISEIIVVKPAEHNQEFFDNVAGKDKVHTEEEYREFLKGLIARDLSGLSQNFFDNSVQKYYEEKYGNMELPVEFFKKWLVSQHGEFTAENIDTEFENILPTLKWQLIRDAIATKLDVKVEEKDIFEYAKAMAFNQFMQYGMTNMDNETIENAAKHILSDKNYRNQIVDRVSNQKLFHAIRQAVNAQVENVSFDKFKELIAAK